MPKLSYAQEVAALEETVAAARSRADVLPRLALVVAGELEENIARIKELKARQRAYAAEGKRVTQALNAEIASGMAQARSIRGCVVLVYGPKSGRLAQFGIRIRRRPQRKAASLPEVPSNPLGTSASAPEAARDEAWTAHAARANVTEIRGTIQEVGGEARGMGGEAVRLGGNAAGEGQRSSRLGEAPPTLGRWRPEVGETHQRSGETSRKLGETPRSLGETSRRAPSPRPGLKSRATGGRPVRDSL